MLMDHLHDLRVASSRLWPVFYLTALSFFLLICRRAFCTESFLRRAHCRHALPSVAYDSASTVVVSGDVWRARSGERAALDVGAVSWSPTLGTEVT